MKRGLFIKARFYRSMNKFHNILKSYFSEFGQLLGIIPLLISAYYIFKKTVIQNQDLDISEIPDLSACLLLGSVLFIFVIILIGKNILNPTGNFIPYLEDYFEFDEKKLKIKQTKIIEIREERIRNSNCTKSSLDLRLADLNDVKDIVRIHKKEYFNSSWLVKKHIVKKRMRANIKKNNRSLLMICDQTVVHKVKGIFPVGYIHMVPLNIYNWNRFKAGEVKDIEIDGNNIVDAFCNSRDNEPFGLLVISITLSRKIVTTSIDYKEYIGKLLIRALANHFYEYMLHEFKNHKFVPVIFQSFRRDVLKKFKPYRTNHIVYSKDHAPIICFDFENQLFQSMINIQANLDHNLAVEDHYIAKNDHIIAVNDHNKISGNYISSGSSGPTLH